MSTIAKLLARLELDTTGFQKSLTGVPGMLNRMGGNMTQVGGSITRGITLPLLAAGAGVVALSGYAVKLGTDFDREMKNIQSISGQSDAEIKTLGDGFLKMSSDITQTTDSATGLANAFYFIQSAGFAGKDGQEILAVSTKAASAGLTDTNTAAKAILSTLSAYGQGSEDAAHVSDVLFKTVDLGVITFEELSSQVGDVVNTAATLNVPIEEVGGAIAQMTRKGISGAESVTALNQLMLQFISPSEKMKKAAEELGVDLSLDAIRTKGLQQSLMDIENIGGPNAMLELFGDNVRALKGALTLTGDNADGFNDIMDEMGNVSGRTNEAFAVQTQSMAAYKKNVQNVFTGMAIGFSGAIQPSLLTVAKNISDFVTNNKPQLEGLFTSLATVIAGLSEDFGPWLEQNGPKLIEFLEKMVTSLPGFITKMGEIGTVIAPQIGKLFDAFMSMDPNTISNIMGAIAGLGALGPILMGLGGAITTISSVMSIIGTIGGVITGAVVGPLLLIIATLGLVVYAFATDFGGITTTVIQMVFIVKFYFDQMATWILDSIKKAGDFVTTKFSEMKTTIMQLKVIFDTVSTGVRNAIGKMITKIGELASKLLGIKIPSWLMPGSPTPFENGLMGIVGAMEKVNKTGLPGLGGSPTMPVYTSAPTSGRTTESSAIPGNKNVIINITNPKKETSEESVAKTLNRLSYLRVLE